MSILVTGGAGYIGAHVVASLQERGEQVVVVDDLSSGLVSRLREVSLIHLDLVSETAVSTLTDVIRQHGVTRAVHLAAHKDVGESARIPAFYWHQNVGGLTSLLRAAQDTDLDRLVYSSSAAVYGTPDLPLVTEDMPVRPLSPYGATKLVGEWMVSDATKAHGLKAVSLRYFNVAGAGSGALAERGGTNLVPTVLAQVGSGKSPLVFGRDYDTPDGTCVRDYVHVLDIAEAHVAALALLDRDEPEDPESGPTHVTFNVGTGVGASVLEVIEAVNRRLGRALPPRFADRRPGDAACVVADVSRIRAALGWQARYDLHDIVGSAMSLAGAGRG